MDFIKKLFGGDIRQLGMIGALVFLILFFQWSTDGLTLTPDNVNNIIRGNAHILVLAIGMVLVIIAGHIDLSVGSVAAAVGILVALAMRDWGLNWFLGILLGLAFGALIGAWQGWPRCERPVTRSCCWRGAAPERSAPRERPRKPHPACG